MDVDTGCWNWSRPLNQNGYGQITILNERLLAYKFVYEMHHGKVKLGVHLDHACANRACVNPYNVRAGTQKQNLQYRKKTTAPRSSRFKGVHRKGKFWAAVIRLDYKHVWLGQYATEIGAARAYNSAAKRYFGEYALLNNLSDLEIPSVEMPLALREN